MSVDSLDLIKTFHEVASRGSFSKAAVSLQLSKATASKYVAELERRLGVRLLHRSTRAISLTDAGQRLLERSTYLVSYAEEMMDELREFGSLPKGGLTLSAPYGLVFGGFSDIIATYVRSYPDVRLTL
ncbi:LysR family transcriptional regulator, partial [Pseudacidovorax intermedius]|uniref:LysR family transcriptional regulator n=1 Tax=Pseudacidovorax intermedius TaxID=433924 RepID=UPI0005BD2D89